jgi:hypothetical protein
MTDLVTQFKAWLPSATPVDRAHALKVIENQTQMIAAALEDVAKNLMEMKRGQIWSTLLEKRNLEIEELLEIENLLKSTS